MRDAFSQQTYQVRCDWGVDGLRRLAPADVVVVVDVLRFTSVVSALVAAGEHVDVAAMRARSLNGAVVSEAAAALAHAPVVMAGSLRNAGAVADAIVGLQAARGGRVSVAVIPGGERVSRADDAPLRFAVEDQLGAGAVVDALGSRGIDHTSPEAAAAGEAFRALRGALRHLVGASGSGRELVERDERQVVADAVALDADAVAPVLVDGVFAAVSRRQAG